MSKKKNKASAAKEAPNGSKGKGIETNKKDGSSSAASGAAMVTNAQPAATPATAMTDRELKKLAGENIASKFAMATMSPGLNISRNKHWRHISSFHGPWLQLPPEILETMAVINYRHPRPQPVDPAIFFDMVRIRKLVDAASDLAVRAASGAVVSGGNASHLSGASNVFGIGLKQARTLQLSPERRSRARIDATMRLAEAYAMDEIAASVATMQGASSLDEVAKIVLNKSISGGKGPDPDALYVHFFHEKIPSRHLSESTGLDELDQVIMAHPNDGRHYRTRATVRLFKEDFDGAVADLTEALRLVKIQKEMKEHNAKREREQLGIQKEVKKPIDRTLKDKAPMPADDDLPPSIEAQLLFHRASVYLDAACHQIYGAMGRPDWGKSDNKDDNKDNNRNPGGDTLKEPVGSATSPVGGDTDKGISQEQTKTQKSAEAQADQVRAHKLLHINAKRALRDYLAFLRHYHYTPELPIQVSEAYARKILAFTFSKTGIPSSGVSSTTSMALKSLLPLQLNASFLAVAQGAAAYPDIADETARSDRPWRVFTIDELFTDPVPNLPPFPSPPVNCEIDQKPSRAAVRALLMQTRPMATYHPLVTDALHSLLLVYCLLQRPPADLQRHAAMVARLSKASDGYPAFQTTHCAARTDWLDVLNMAWETGGLTEIPDNWKELSAPPKADKKKKAAAAAARKNAANALSVPKDRSTTAPASNGTESAPLAETKMDVTSRNEVAALADATNKLDLTGSVVATDSRKTVASTVSPNSRGSPVLPSSPTEIASPSSDTLQSPSRDATTLRAASTGTSDDVSKKAPLLANDITSNHYSLTSERAVALSRWTIDFLHGNIAKPPGSGSKGKKKPRRPAAKAGVSSPIAAEAAVSPPAEKDAV